MTRTNRLLVIFNTLLATILVLVLIQFAPSVASAKSTTIVACANEKTGVLRIAYKKCTKSENNVTWGITGPQGATGAKGDTGAQGLAGPAGAQAPTGAVGSVVRDATGAVVEGVIQANFFGSYFYSVFVFKEDAFWVVDSRTGEFSSNTGMFSERFYLNSDCTGAKVAPADYPRNYALGSNLYDSSNVYIGPEYYRSFGPTRTGDVYRLYDGQCSASPYTDKYIQITSIAKPNALPAPFYLSPN